MAITPPVMYPEDLSGLKSTNLVAAEIKRPKVGLNQIIVPDYGPFFVESLKIIDLNTGKPIAPTTQYVVAQFEQELSTLAGKEICSVISIIDQSLNKGGLGYELTYQTVGGPYSYSVQSIIDMILALDLDNRPVEWKEILGKPDRFVPAPHPHNINDISGWSVLFPAFDSIRNAILLSDQAVLDALRTGFQAEIDKIVANHENLRQNLANHLNDFQNPHRLHIHDINGLTADEIAVTLTRYLPVDGKAVDSGKLDGRTSQQVRDWIVSSIQNAELKNGQLPASALAAGYTAEMAAKDLPFPTAKGYRNFAEVAQPYLDQYLPLQGKAVDSTRFDGATQGDYRTWLVGTIQNNELVRGQFNPATLATGWSTTVANMAMPIPTANGWKNFPDLIAQFGGGTAGAYYAGATTAAQIAVTYSDNTRYPVGTLVTYHYNHQIGHGTGNGGTYYTNHNTRVIIQKYQPGSWITVATYQGDGYL